MSVSYRQGPVRARPLIDVNLDVDAEPTAVMGPSGSGKSTLLRVLAGLQRPDSGEVRVEGERVSVRKRNGRGDARVALIHQDYRLVEFLPVAENLRLAAEMRAATATATDVAHVLRAVELDGFERRWPATLSGGEQQRVAIARALITRPTVLLADEPTGALDGENSLIIARLFRDLGAEHGIAVLVATHDSAVADQLPRRTSLVAGVLRHQVQAR